MITWRNGTVSGTRREWPGAVELDVSVDGAPDEGKQVRALAYPALTGRPRPGDRVLMNTTALDLGLGTGGYALVVALPDRLPPDPELSGHLVKARYSPLQATVLGADEQGSPHHGVLRDADDIGDTVPLAIEQRGHNRLRQHMSRRVVDKLKRDDLRLTFGCAHPGGHAGFGGDHQVDSRAVTVGAVAAKRRHPGIDQFGVAWL